MVVPLIESIHSVVSVWLTIALNSSQVNSSGTCLCALPLTGAESVS